MFRFALAVVGYLLLVRSFFDQGVAPVGKRLQRNMIPLPKNTIDAVVLFASMIYPMNAFVTARKSDWGLSDSKGAMAVVAGVVLGMISNVEDY
ncbi:unnamed protein product [Ectocarpus sp. 12 AP-2014]